MVWAVVVVVAVRPLGPIFSGGISAMAGVAFVLQSATAGASLTSLAGYATLGGIFFLVSALRLRNVAGAVV